MMIQSQLICYNRTSPTGGQDSDLEKEDIEILNTTELLREIAEEVEVFNIQND